MREVGAYKGRENVIGVTVQRDNIRDGVEGGLDTHDVPTTKFPSCGGEGRGRCDGKNGTSE